MLLRTLVEGPEFKPPSSPSPNLKCIGKKIHHTHSTNVNKTPSISKTDMFSFRVVPTKLIHFLFRKHVRTSTLIPSISLSTQIDNLCLICRFTYYSQVNVLPLMGWKEYFLYKFNSLCNIFSCWENFEN